MVACQVWRCTLILEQGSTKVSHAVRTLRCEECKVTHEILKAACNPHSPIKIACSFIPESMPAASHPCPRHPRSLRGPLQGRDLQLGPPTLDEGFCPQYECILIYVVTVHQPLPRNDSRPHCEARAESISRSTPPLCLLAAACSRSKLRRASWCTAWLITQSQESFLKPVFSLLRLPPRW